MVRSSYSENVFKIFFLSVIIKLCIINETNAAPICGIPAEDERFDCHPEDFPTEEKCVARGCCWKTNKNNTLGISSPFCFFPLNFPSYRVINDQSVIKSDGASYFINKMTPTFRENEILNLTVDLFYDTQERLRVKIYDPYNERYEVPLNVDSDSTKLKKSAHTDYYVNIVDEPFAIKVYRRSTQSLVFDTSIAPFIYADQFIQFSSYLPNNYVYGIGEHRDSFQHITDWSRYTIWNKGFPPVKHVNLYGSHPFYLSIEDDGNAMGFFLMNSNAMDVVLQPYPAITFLTIGGILDFYVYMGPTPNDVIRQHMITVGLPFMPPYFTLGFHLCRWGYGDQEKLKNVINRNRAAKIPYDTQWTDIDVMSEKKDWTYDTEKYSNLTEIVKDLHDHGQHYINIIDPAILIKPGYFPYDEGIASDVFIKYYNSSEALVGKVWPGDTLFPDFTYPNTTVWWSNMAKRFHDSIEFDGIWIDMNEPSSFVGGSINGCTNNSLDKPPYIPKVLEGELYTGTICPSSQQYLSSHYNLHNMYGHFEAKATFNALKSIDNSKRPFVLSRSSFSGTGHYAAHWSGDNRATWLDLYYSIPSILNFNMYGVPMIGADICGFTLDTTEELCIRWMQLGAFYPFMRNHNQEYFKDQDPAAFSEKAQDIMRNVLNLRYFLLPYAYTLHYRSHVFGETVVRPLFFEFPTDLNTHSIDTQFLFGPALLISPVLTPLTEHVESYFPNATWYDIYTGELINKTLTHVTLDAPLTKINVHVRGGNILPLQYPNVTTKESRKNPFLLLVALNADPNIPSYGSLFWDDGITPETVESNKYNLYRFYAISGNLQIEVDDSHIGYDTNMILGTIIVYGEHLRPNNVLLNGELWNDFSYDTNYNVLTIQNIGLDLYKLKVISVKWI